MGYPGADCILGLIEKVQSVSTDIDFIEAHTGADNEILSYFFETVQADALDVDLYQRVPIDYAKHAASFVSTLDEDNVESAELTFEELEEDLEHIFTALSSAFMGTTSVADVVLRRVRRIEEGDDFDDY